MNFISFLFFFFLLLLLLLFLFSFFENTVRVKQLCFQKAFRFYSLNFFTLLPNIFFMSSHLALTLVWIA